MAPADKAGASRAENIRTVFFVFLGLALLLALATLLRPGPSGPPRAAALDCQTVAAGDAPPLRLEPVVGGLEVPLFAAHAGDGSGRLFVVEKGGLVRVLEGGALQDEPFLDLRDRVSTVAEEGLLSIAFHPRFASNGRVFAFYSLRERPASVIEEFRAPRGGPAEPVGRVLLEIPQSADTHVHRGGQLAFGNDDFLYASVGDGSVWPQGSARAQDLGDLRGSLLRLNVDSGAPYRVPRGNPWRRVAGSRPEIWAHGFRNPWRFSVDPCTGRIFLADVGEARFEAIYLAEAGANYGWPVMEANHCMSLDPQRASAPRERCGEARFARAVHSYPHLQLDPSGGNSVIGGRVYRGRRLSGLAGRYLFADFSSGRIWTLSETVLKDAAGSYREWQADEVYRDDQRFTAFGEDEDGELYIMSASSGTLYQLELVKD